jgi:hypothetical protein
MKPVAWTDGKGNYFDKTSSFPVDDLIPLYTHPIKELTDEEIWEVINRTAWVGTEEEIRFKIAEAILRKAQSNCNGFCGEYECKENQAHCKRLKKASEKWSKVE